MKIKSRKEPNTSRMLVSFRFFVNILLKHKTCGFAFLSKSLLPCVAYETCKSFVQIVRIKGEFMHLFSLVLQIIYEVNMLST
ncbi:hypothetical protein Hdeb2414_s0016g00487881 [Helianthus debilis subsp. tardiflorus]